MREAGLEPARGLRPASVTGWCVYQFRHSEGQRNAAKEGVNGGQALMLPDCPMRRTSSATRVASPCSDFASAYRIRDSGLPPKLRLAARSSRAARASRSANLTRSC